RPRDFLPQEFRDRARRDGPPHGDPETHAGRRAPGRCLGTTGGPVQIMEWLKSGWAIALVVLGLGLIIFIHELGHFIMAKKNKVRVEVFSLGFALGIPRLVLWKRKWGETEYRICAVPFGGYVKMAGETLVDLER